MPKILIINKNTTMSEVNYETTDDIFKLCGFSSQNGFEKHHTWVTTVKNKTFKISLYGCNCGNAGQENKYDLPPPEDTTLFFGKIALQNEEGDMTKDLWNKIYEKLFGGFFDLTNTDDEEESDELDEYPDTMKTKSGYLKDGFVVSDNEDENSEDEVDETIFIYSDEEN